MISCFSATNTGNGGHYHSVKMVAHAYKKKYPQSDVRIISVGNFPPPALYQTHVPCEHVHVGIRELWQPGAWMSRLCDAPPTHVHAFDRKAFFFAALLARKFGANLYLTKPGGPNPGFYFPFCEDLFVFSKENEEWFRARKKFARCRIHFLPNRTTHVPADMARIDDMRQRYDLSGFVVLRIGRISPYYWRTAQQTLHLADVLRSRGMPAKAVFIGVVESNAALQKILESKHSTYVVVTDPVFTRNAAELLPIADVVVGTGRSAMEAAIAGKPVVCPTQDFDLPVLLTKQTVAQLMRANFSERSSIADPEFGEGSAAPERLISLLSDTQRLTEVRSETAAIAAEFFDIDKAIARYSEVYSRRQGGQLSVAERVVLWCGVAVACLRSSARG